MSFSSVSALKHSYIFNVQYLIQEKVGRQIKSHALDKDTNSDLFNTGRVSWSLME